MRSGRVMALALAAATAVSLDARPAPRLAVAPSITILSRATGVEVLRLEGRRTALERCAVAALGEDRGAATSLGYALRIAPNGDVANVELAPRGRLSRGAQACFVGALASVLFDPPEGGGRVLRGEILVGARAASSPAQAADLLAPEPDGVGVTDLAPLALHARPPPPEGRAVDAAVRAAWACATGGHGRMRVRLLATDGGALRRVTVDGDLPASSVECARSLLASAPSVRGSSPERAVAVDVEVVVDGGQVRIAR